MIPVGLVRGGFLRAFPRSLRGSSETASHGIFQRRRCAQRRRSLLSFSPRRPAVLLSLPSRPAIGCRAPVPAHANRRAVPSLFHIFLPPGRTSFFTQPSCQRYRAPLFLHPFVPLGGRDSAAFFAACTGGGVVRSLFALSAARPALHLFFYTPPPGERMPRVRSRPCEPAGSPFPFPHFPTARSYFFLYPAVLPAIPRTVAEAMLAEGLVRGGFLRGFAGPPRRCFPMGSSEAASHGVLQGRRGDASRWARPRRPSAGFSNGGTARSAAVPFCPSLPRRPAVLLSLPSRPANDAARARRGDASRWARLRRASPAGFSNAAKAMLPDGLV